MRALRIILCLAIACPSIALARGRRPDDDADNFPDYNKLEMRPRPRNTQTSTNTVTDTPAPSTPTLPPAPPALNTPVNPAPEVDVAPQPPPKAVPLPDDSSEPPLPQDIKDTLMPGATNQ